MGDRRDEEASGVTLTHHGNIDGVPSFTRLHDAQSTYFDWIAMRLTSHHGGSTVDHSLRSVQLNVFDRTTRTKPSRYIDRHDSSAYRI